MMQPVRSSQDMARHRVAEDGESRDAEGDLGDTKRFGARELRALVRSTEERSIEVPLDDLAVHAGIPRAPPSPPVRAPIPSSFEILARSTPLLVLSDSVATRLPIGAVETPVAPARPPADAAPSVAPSKVATAIARRERAPKRYVRLVADYEQNVLYRGYFKRRFRALALIGLVVLARPWWWDVGDVRARAAVLSVRPQDHAFVGLAWLAAPNASVNGRADGDR